LAKSFGKALELAIKEEEGAQRANDGKSRHLLMNSCRRDILSRLSLTPCISISDIASAVRVNPNTVRWHLDRLIDADYVLRRKSGKRWIFYPQGLLQTKDMNIFKMLNQRTQRKVLFQLVKRPGTSMSQLAKDLGFSRQSLSHRLEELEEVGVVKRLSDGGLARHYLTTCLSDAGEGFYERSKRFLIFILKKFSEEEGAKPIILKKGLDRVVVEIGPRTSRFTMILGVNPYLTVFDNVL
jgi:DNA-binding transcriptional ArsR family regulator